MKPRLRFLPLLLIIPILALSGCVTDPATGKKVLNPAGKAIVVGAGDLAAAVGTAAATYYGGPIAGNLAGAILNGAAKNLQGYVGQQVTPRQVQAITGVAPYINKALAKNIKPTKPLTQADINLVYDAAAIAGDTSTFKDPTNGAPAVR